MVQFNRLNIDDERGLAHLVLGVTDDAATQVTMDFASAENLSQALAEVNLGPTLRSWAYGKLREHYLQAANADPDHKWHSLTPMQQRELLDSLAKALCFGMEDAFEVFMSSYLEAEHDPEDGT